MWILFVLCATYCRSFFQCQTSFCANYVNTTKGIPASATSWSEVVYCMDYEVVNTLTKPGYLCSSFSRRGCSNSVYIGQTATYAWYCCDYKLKTPAPTPKPTPQITRTPQITLPKPHDPKCRSFDFKPLLTFFIFSIA